MSSFVFLVFREYSRAPAGGCGVEDAPDGRYDPRSRGRNHAVLYSNRNHTYCSLNLPNSTLHTGRAQRLLHRLRGGLCSLAPPASLAHYRIQTRPSHHGPRLGLTTGAEAELPKRRLSFLKPWHSSIEFNVHHQRINVRRRNADKPQRP